MATKCPHCGAVWDIDPKYYGTDATCTNCNCIFTMNAYDSDIDNNESVPINQSIGALRMCCRIGGAICIGFIAWRIYKVFVVGGATLDAWDNRIWFLYLGIALFSLLFSFTEPVERYVHVICPNQNCNYVGEAKTTGGPNGCVFFILLLLAVVPALIYYLVCGKQRTVICPKCGIRIR